MMRTRAANLITSAVSAVVILLSQAACGGDGGPTPPPQTPLPPTPPPVAPVQVGAIPDRTVTTGQTATLDVSSFFRDPDGGALTYTAESSAPAVVSVSLSGSTLTLEGVRAGTATVTVTARDPGGLTAEQRFNVTVDGDGGDDHSCVAGRETVLAWASSAAGVLTAGDEDCFSVVVPATAASGRVTAWTSGDTDSYGTLYDSAYGVLDENDDWFSTNFLVTHDAASPGRYYIRVRGYDSDESGLYTIHVDDHGDSIESATEDWEAVAFDSVANAGSIAVPGNQDVFAFWLFRSALMSVGTYGSMDTYGTLYDGDGDTVGEDNDSGPGRNFRIERQLEEGVYFVEVRGFGNDTGSYELGIGAVGVRHSLLPAWSPDGSRIAFTSDRDGTVDIYTMDAGGTGVRRLTNDVAWDMVPEWSPDGSRIAFASDRDGSVDIYTMNPDGTGVTRLTDDAAWDLDPAWSPDGSRIAFRSDRDDGFYEQIYVMNADGTGITRLTGISEWFDASPAWSPDGSRIAFASDRDGDNGDIYAMNADGTGLTRLTSGSAEDLYPAWSPDGSRIAFMSDRDGNFEIYAMNTDGTGVRRLTTTAAEGDAADDLFSEWIRSGSGPAFRFAPDRNHKVQSADGAAPAGQDVLLRSGPKPPVLKTVPQRRRGRRD